jgi:hypothetical protein
LDSICFQSAGVLEFLRYVDALLTIFISAWRRARCIRISYRQADNPEHHRLLQVLAICASPAMVARMHGLFFSHQLDRAFKRVAVLVLRLHHLS